MRLPKIKAGGRRNPWTIGAMGLVILACVTVAAFKYDKLPFAKNTTDYAAAYEVTPAREGLARFSETPNNRDNQMRNLLGNANKVSGVLGRRSQHIASLVADSNALLAALLDERDSIDALMNNLTAVSHQVSGLVNDNRTQLKPALDKLNGVLEVLDNRKQDIQATLPKFKRYAMSFGECLGSGPFFKAYVA